MKENGKNEESTKQYNSETNESNLVVISEKADPPAVDHYVIVVGSMIIEGPKFTDSQEEIDDCFERARIYNEEEGKEVVRIYGPRRNN